MKHLYYCKRLAAFAACAACALAGPAPAYAQAPGVPAQPAQPAPAQPAPIPAPPPAQPTPPAVTPEGAEMSLGSVLEVAVRQQPELQRATIDVAIADAAVLEAAGIDDWVIAVTGAWSSSRIRELNLNQDSINAQVDLVRQLSTGGTLALRADTGYTSNNIQGTTYDDTVAISLNQPLLRGRGKRIARARNRQAALSLDAAELARRGAAIAAVRDVVRAYWELAFAVGDLDIRRSSLELAREQLKLTRAAIEAGSVAPTEALAVEQTIAQREEEILAAELAISERSLDLRRVAGLEIGPRAIDLAIRAPLVMSVQPLALDALLSRALESSPQIAALEAQARGDRIEVEVTENGLLPELDLSLSFGPTGAADNPKDALRAMAEFEDLTFNARLTLRHAFGQRAARGGHRRARARLLRTAIDLEDIRAQIATAVVRAVKAAQVAEKRYAISERTIDLATKNIEAEKARFELGRATNFDVLQRQEELKRAQLGQARAVVDYLQAIAAIEAITGEILDRYGVTLDAVDVP